MDTKIRLPLRALGRHAFPKWNQLASSTWHEVKLTWRGRHFKNAPQNKMKIPTVPPTHVPTPPWIKTHQDYNTMSKNKAALRSSSPPGGCGHMFTLWGTHIIPKRGQSELQFPHTLTLHGCSGNLSQNHFQSGLTLLGSAPPERAGALPLSLNKGRMSPIFWGGAEGVS